MFFLDICITDYHWLSGRWCQHPSTPVGENRLHGWSIAKLSPSTNSSGAELVLFPVEPTNHLIQTTYLLQIINIKFNLKGSVWDWNKVVKIWLHLIWLWHLDFFAPKTLWRQPVRAHVSSHARCPFVCAQTWKKSQACKRCVKKCFEKIVDIFG